MGYVYRYTDLDDNQIKYVGIVWSDNRTLKQRIREHEYNDDWCKGRGWKIEYISENIETRTDAEYLESHYISRFGTGRWYNIAKSGWGVSSFIKDRDDWQLYDIEREQELDILKQRIERLENRNNELLDEICSLKKQKESLIDQLREEVESKRYSDTGNKTSPILTEEAHPEKVSYSGIYKKEPVWTKNKSLFNGVRVKNKITNTDELVARCESGFYCKRRMGTRHLSIPCRLTLYVGGKKKEWRYFNSIKECSEFSGLRPDEISASIYNIDDFHRRYFGWDGSYLNRYSKYEARGKTKYQDCDCYIAVSAVTPKIKPEDIKKKLQPPTQEDIDRAIENHLAKNLLFI